MRSALLLFGAVCVGATALGCDVSLERNGDHSDWCAGEDLTGLWLECGNRETMIGCDAFLPNGVVLRSDRTWVEVVAPNSAGAAADPYCEKAGDDLVGHWSYADGAVTLVAGDGTSTAFTNGCLVKRLVAQPALFGPGMLPAMQPPLARAKGTSLGSCKALGDRCEQAAECLSAICDTARCVAMPPADADEDAGL